MGLYPIYDLGAPPFMIHHAERYATCEEWHGMKPESNLEDDFPDNITIIWM